MHQELYGFLLAHYLVRRALWESATQAQVDPDVLSFTHTVHVLTRRIPQLVGMIARRTLAERYQACLAEILEERVSSSRGASVPRGVRRYPKSPIRDHGPTSPRRQDSTVTILPVAA